MQIQKLQNGYKCIFKTSAMISIITPGDQAFYSISYCTFRLGLRTGAQVLIRGIFSHKVCRTQIPGGENRADNIIIKYTQPSKKAFKKTILYPVFFIWATTFLKSLKGTVHEIFDQYFCPKSLSGRFHVTRFVSFSRRYAIVKLKIINNLFS